MRVTNSPRRCNCRKHLRWTADGKQSRKTAGTRSWAEAEERKHELLDQLAGRTQPRANGRDIRAAVQVFIQDKKVQGLSPDVIGEYTRALTRLQAYCESKGIYVVQGITRDVVTGFCSDWDVLHPSILTRAKLRERYKSFLNYCYQAQWLERDPAWPVMRAEAEVETQPLAPDEYLRLLAAIGPALAAGDPRRATAANNGRRSPDEEEALKRKVRAFIGCMRWSGLAMRDALTLPKTAVTFDTAFRITAKRIKTGTAVSVPIPPEVARDILAVAAGNFGDYVFWTGKGKPQSAASNWGTRYIVPVFKAAGLHGDYFMVSHRLRDTFAVHLLEAGAPMEEVSRLLGHRSIRVTEKHYAKWSRGRQDRADGFVARSWAVPKKDKAQPGS